MMRTISYPVPGSSLREATPITAEPILSRILVRFLATREEVSWLRKPVRAALLIAGIILVMAGPGWAQQQEADPIVKLKEQIKNLEAIDRDENTPDEVRSVNRSFLEERRTELKALVEKKVEALQKRGKLLQAYLDTTGGSLTEDQTQRLKSSIRSVSIELQNLGRNTQANLHTKSSASSTVTSNLIASTQPTNVPSSSSEQLTPESALVSSEESNAATSHQRSITDSSSEPTASYKVSNIPLSDRRLAANDSNPQARASTTEVRVKGTVYVANMYFYKNPEEATPARLQQQRLAVRFAKTDRNQLTPEQRELVDTASAPEKRDDKEKDPNHPLSNVEVKIKDSSGKEIKKKPTTSLGEYDVMLGPGDYTISVETENFSTSEPLSIPQSAPAEIRGPDLQLVVRPLGEFSRAIVGLEQAGASSAKSVQKYFLDLTISGPLPFQSKIDPFFGTRGRAWGTIRVTTVPQQINSTVATFVPAFATEISNVKVNEVAQAVEFLAGVEYRLKGGKAPRLFGSFDNSTANKLTLSLIAGVGAITPFNPRDTLQIFKVFPGATGLPPQAEGKDFVAFVSPDRDRFFRQYYAGLRLQTYYFNARNPDIPLNRFPATVDLTFGQNEAVTGGRLRGGIVRLEGFYPLPYESMKFINLFGTAMMKLSSPRITDPLILEQAPAGTIVPATNAVIVTIPQINRDYYRIGVGIDFISFVKSLGGGQK